MHGTSNLPFLCLLAALAAAAQAQAESGVYSNQRFGFSIRYPSSLLRPAAAHGPNGQAFTSLAGHAGFRVFAAPINGRSPAEIANSAQAICPDRRPSYRVVKPALVAISCKVGDYIVYQKSLLQGDLEVTVRGEYPQHERDRWDPVVTSIARSMSTAPRNAPFPD